MQNSSRFLAIALLAGTALAQTTPDIIYYPFIEGTGTSVKNFYAGGPATGTIMGTATTQWATGKTNSALAGAASLSVPNYVDTGWKITLKDDFSFAFFMKQASSPGTALSYVMSGDANFRTFTNGVAGTGLWCRAWGGTPADLKLTTNIQTLAAAGWVHCALVVDWTKSKTAVWYVDGKAANVTVLTAGANLTSTANLRCGLGSSTSSSWTYDTDEFRFLNRAASPGEVAAWAALTPSGDGAYNKASCGGTLASKNGPPAIGNGAYQLSVTGNASSPFFLSIGFKRAALIVDLGLIWPPMKGCTFDSSLDLVLVGATNAAGSATVPLPIPNDAGLSGANLWNQGAVLVNEQGLNGFNVYIR